MGTVAGCYVRTARSSVKLSPSGWSGTASRSTRALASLKRFKDDAQEVAENYECGLTVEKFNDIKEGDIIEGFTMEEIHGNVAGLTLHTASRRPLVAERPRTAVRPSVPRLALRRGCLIQSSCETHFMGLRYHRGVYHEQLPGIGPASSDRNHQPYLHSRQGGRKRPPCFSKERLSAA